VTSAPLPLASFKLQFGEERIRIVPLTGLDGCPFSGPGVDLVGAEARPLLALAQPVLDWFSAREPGITVRSLSIDLATGRVLVTYVQPGTPEGARPHVVRVDAPASSDVIDQSALLAVELSSHAAAKLAKRS
jgi:hypothetical protein